MKRSVAEAFAPEQRAPLPYKAEDIISAIEPITLAERSERIARAARTRINSVVAVIESLADPHNAAAILRTCDGLGVGEVHAIEHNTRLLITTRVTKGCDKWMDLRRHAKPQTCMQQLRARGYGLYVADMRATKPLEELARLPRVALVFGNEHEGVSEETRALADGSFSIPMRGMVESFNVSVAVAMALYEVTRTRTGELDEATIRDWQARFLMESVREPELVVERYLRSKTQGA